VGDFEKITVTADKIKEGWNNLVIEARIKRLLKAMVSDHATTMGMDRKANLPRSGTAIDIVRGKGRGRIVFLYGPPGVGKACYMPDKI
jgi:ATP-dependent Lon protease